MTAAALLRWSTVRALCAVLGLLALSAAAQPADEADEPKPNAADTAQVEVTRTTNDGSIARRLESIYDATGRYSGVTVTVDDGVVFLSGVAESEDAAEWARDLAGRTEGVVAVNNSMTVAPQPIWSIRPARQELRELWREAVTSVPLVIIGLAGLVMFVLAGRLASGVLSGWMAPRVESPLVRNVIAKLVFVLIVLAGIYLFLRVSGLTRLAVTIVGGTGVAGIVLGFAFRDIAENFLASILISIQKPFRLGDVIEVEGHLGVVQKVTMRGTLLMDFDGNHIQIANAAVYKSTIKNFTANPKARIGFSVGVGYDADVEQAQILAMEALAAHPAVLDDPQPQVLVDQLASSTVNLMIYFWIDGSAHSVLKLKSAGLRMVLRALLDAGVSMPDDQREVIFPQGVPVRLNGDEDAPRPSPTPQRGRPPPEPGATPSPPPAESIAEGGLETEATEIRKQAAESRQPEEGEDILAEG